jgi:hypothetical protein
MLTLLNYFPQHRSNPHVDRAAGDSGKKDPQAEAEPNVSIADAVVMAHQQSSKKDEKVQLEKRAAESKKGEDIKVDKGASVGLKLVPTKIQKKKKWKKPKDKPKRPLSAYNLFFQHEREKLLYGTDQSNPQVLGSNPKPEKETIKETGDKAHGRGDGKLGFAALAKDVAAKWKALSPEQKQKFEKEAVKEKERYKRELEEWKHFQLKRKRESEEWSARREHVIRSLSNMAASEQERAERALRAEVSMQPFSNATGYHQQISADPGDLLRSHLHSQLDTYGQPLVGDPYGLRQRLLAQEQSMSSLHDSPMDLYARLIYSGASDLSAADAMHSYLAAQYAAAGRSLGLNLGASSTGSAGGVGAAYGSSGLDNRTEGLSSFAGHGGLSAPTRSLYEEMMPSGLGMFPGTNSMLEAYMRNVRGEASDPGSPARHDLGDSLNYQRHHY